MINLDVIPLFMRTYYNVVVVLHLSRLANPIKTYVSRSMDLPISIDLSLVCGNGVIEN